jgi:mono/diheme cytochrome c family protein
MRIGLLVVTGLLACPAAAQDAAQGAALFAANCAACHGAAAEGNGPMAEVLEVQPADLTALAAGNGGAFPMARAVRAIDGRTKLLSHGGPMPLFGTILGGEPAVIDAEDGTPIITKAAVVDIAAWLAAIQD